VTTPARPAPRHAARLAVAGLFGVLVNAIVLLLSPLLRPEISLLDGGLSEYGIGPWAALQNVGFFALGAGSLAIAAALSLAPIPSPWLPLGTALLALAAAASAGLAVFPMDAPGPATFLGDTHQTAGTLSVGLQLAALLATALAFRSAAGWRPLAARGLLLFSTALAGALLTQAKLLWEALPIPLGVSMRMIVVPVLIWWATVALNLRAPNGWGVVVAPTTARHGRANDPAYPGGR
jgi:hypothetical protein